MPSREDLERFSHVLNSLGSESDSRAKGEAPAQEPAAAEELPPDLGDLLGAPGEPAAGGDAAAPEEGLDFSSLFGDESAPAGEAPSAPEVPAEPEVPPSVSGPDVDAMEMISEDDLGSLDGLPGGLEEPQAAPPEEALPAGPEEPAAPPDFGLPLPEPGGFEEPAPAAEPGEPLPEIGAPVEGGAPPEQAGPEEPAFPLDFELPSPEPGQPSAEGFTPAEFELPSPEESAPAPAEPSAAEPATPEPPAFELPESFDLEPSSGEEAAPQGAAPSPLEGIELPSFEEMELTGEPAAPKPPPKESAPGPAAEGLDFSLPEEFDFGEAGQAEHPALERAAAEEGAGDHGLDEFTLPESVEEFGVQQKPAARPAIPSSKAPSGGQEPIEELGALEGEIELTDAQFTRLKKTLESLPRNLKIAVQDVIADKGASAANIKILIGLLVQGAAPARVAEAVGKITGKRIRLPAGVEKRTGIAFEEERKTFLFALRENVWPVFRTFFLTFAGLALFLFAGYRFAYLPMRAFLNYRSGYEHLLGGRSELANQSFNRAVSDWPMKSWYYRYAEGFGAKNDYPQAFAKYDSLLERWPLDRKGRIDYARMKSSRFYFKDAEDLLKPLLDRNMYDYDAVLASGDNYLAWASAEPARYEDARLAYALLLDKYGEQPALLFRMMRYFIRADKDGDKLEEIEFLREFFQERTNITVDPGIYAELGGYLMDRQQMTYVKDVLLRSLEAKGDIPDAYYQLGRYYLLVDDPAMEVLSLQKALERMQSSDVLTFQRIAMEVDSHTRLGEAYYRQKNVLEAEAQFIKAIEKVEDYQKRNLVGKNKIFGNAYRAYGDLAYYESGDIQSGGLDQAYLRYGKAKANGDSSPEMDYKIGYILYMRGDYKAALDSFLAAADAMAPARIPPNLLFATGNAFYQRDDHFAAQGYYMRLAGYLNDMRAGLSNFQPLETPDDAFLVENLWKTNNNLGVVTFRISEKMGDRRKRSEALVYLTSAAEEYDAISRNPETLARPEAKNLPALNMTAILYPAAKFSVTQIYVWIPKDFESPVF